MRVLALDHGEVRCGTAVCDPTGELVTPVGVVERPDTRRGFAAVVDLVRERQPERIVVGLPLTPSGDEGEQARAARGFSERLAAAVDIPVELYDERLTTKLADRTGGSAPADARAAAHLLEGWLTAQRSRR